MKTLAPLSPRFVSVTYGAGGSTRERTHATVARIARETALAPAAHLTCVEASRGRDRRHRPRLLGGGHPPHRRAARRSARAGQRLRAAPGRLCQCRRAGRGAEAGRAVRDLGRRLSRMPSRFGEQGRRSRQSQAQDRRRRRPRDHPVLLLARMLLPLPRRGRGGRDRCRARARHPAGLQRRPDPQVRGAVRRRPSPTGWTACSRGSTICPPRASSSPPPSPPSCAASSMRAASASSISTRSNRAELAYAICHLLGLRPKEDRMTHRRTA